MSVGLIIKQERLKQNMKQIVLCKGICSVSYLSKIESNSFQPSDEVLGLLLKQLKLNPSEITIEDETEVITHLYEVYKTAITKRDIEAINCFLVQATNNPVHFSKASNYTSYLLHIFRLYLILNDDMNEIRHLATTIQSLDKSLSDKEQFLLNYNLGLFHYEDREYIASLNHMERALEYLESRTIKDWEVADFYNALSLTYYQNQELLKASYYASLSLPIFKDQLLFDRAVDNYIVLGNISKGLKDYAKAENNLLMAQRLIVELNLTTKEAMILHNIGSLNALKGEAEIAIHYYSMSLSKREMGSEKYYLTVLSIIKEYSKEKNFKQVIRWCDDALSSLGNVPPINKRLKPYYVHFTLYKALHSFDEKLESILKKAIKFFEKEQDLRHVQKYNYLLAEYYTKHNKYKAAVSYYEKIKEISFSNKMIKHWEDL
ncbi:helix-turn-helix transcriptional regulator [Paenisporosarcina sp. FSL H8-0542]|uniref:helix-turn-helix transcriptional regulator n=1 Tax=Paenisporosarcina sp. FSL H8-0542 TaxID=2921401 RepID=UPI00315B092B